MLVATLQPPDGGVDFGRALDALVGGGCALLVSSLLLPVNPLRLLSESAGPVLDGLVEALEQPAEALADAPSRGRRRGAAGARPRRRRPATAWSDTLEAAGEAARLSPQRRGALGGLDRYAVAAGQLGRVIENLRALARGAMRAINVDDSVPPEAVQGDRRAGGRRRGR